MLKFLHGYAPELWEGYKKHGLLREQDGIRFMQNFLTPDEFRFNKLAAKDGELYNLIKEENRPFYIDRLQGGAIIFEYDFDQNLLTEYENILGEDFLGFQMHEWLSNYKSDQNKCKDVTAENWNEENITAAVKKAFPCKNLLLEAMTMEEMLSYGKVSSAKELYDNMTEIYKKRLAIYKKLVPVDSKYAMYYFEAENGAKLIMPEIGQCSYKGMTVMMAYARGITKAYGIKLGAYYEPWGGSPFSVCTYFPNDENDWFISDPEDFPFKFAGQGGGSSRSLQWRAYLYAYLSGADYLSEEWGAFNTFLDEECNTLSPYGEVKKRFVEFLEKYPTVGEKLSPVAVVLPNTLPTYVVGCDEEDNHKLYGYDISPEDAKKLCKMRREINKLFFSFDPILGNEPDGITNSNIPDAVDMLNYCDGKALKNYDYIVDLTEGKTKIHHNTVCADEVKDLLKKVLPCRVDGGLHYLINKKIGGGYYLTIFNNNGIYRSVEEGEIKLPEAEKTVTLKMNKGFEDRKLKVLEGDGILTEKENEYTLTLPAGGFMFMEF